MDCGIDFFYLFFYQFSTYQSISSATSSLSNRVFIKSNQRAWNLVFFYSENNAVHRCPPLAIAKQTLGLYFGFHFILRCLCLTVFAVEPEALQDVSGLWSWTCGKSFAPYQDCSMGFASYGHLVGPQKVKSYFDDFLNGK